MDAFASLNRQEVDLSLAEVVLLAVFGVLDAASRARVLASGGTALTAAEAGLSTAHTGAATAAVLAAAVAVLAFPALRRALIVRRVPLRALSED